MLPLPVYFNINPPASWYICLPAATWAVYLADHLIDSAKNKIIRTPRHTFIAENRNYIIALIAGLIVIGVTAFFKWYDVRLFITGITVGMFCVMYLLMAWYNDKLLAYFYNKELFVAITYSVGIFMPFGLSIGFSPHFLSAFFVFCGIVYLSILGNSIIEFYEEQGFTWIKLIGINRAKVLFYTLAVSLLTLTIIFSSEKLFIAYTVMIVFQLLIFLASAKLKRYELYRKLSELLFWLPVFVI